MLLEIGPYRLDVDVEKTRAFYAGQDGTGCDCAGCRNYQKAVPALAEPVQAFLMQFGIDPGKPAEMSAVHSPDGRETLYDGFFHICGTFLSSVDLWIQTEPKRFDLKPEYRINLDSVDCAYITKDCALVNQAFPRPVIQLNITFSLPWVLEEPNPYR